MKHLLALALALSTAACGDNEKPFVPVDSGIDAPPPAVRAVVVAGDFTPGSPGVLSVVDMETRTVMPNVGPAMAIGDDPVLRKIGGELLVVNRTSNNVTILDAVDFSVIEQQTTGQGSNPQDVAVVDDKLFVATLSGTGLVELRRGFSVPTPIDLTADDPDGVPNCNSVHRIDNFIYVACELLDENFAPRGPGKIYVVDPNTRVVTRTVTLTTANPINLLQQIPPHAPNAGDLVIGTIDFATGAGCLERIAVGADPTAAGCVLTNAELGGYAARVDYYAPEFTGPVTAIIPTQVMWTVVSDPVTFTASVKAYDINSGTSPIAMEVTGQAQAPGDLTVCPTGDVVVSDAPFGGTGGLRVYRGPMELTTMTLPVGLNPASIAGLVCY